MATPIPPELRRYLDGLLTLAGLPRDPAEQEQALQDLFQRLNRFTFQAYINSLTPPTRAIFEEMVAAHLTPFELERFIHDNIADLARVHTNALHAFRRQYLHEVAVARKKEHRS